MVFLQYLTLRNHTFDSLSLRNEQGHQKSRFLCVNLGSFYLASFVQHFSELFFVSYVLFIWKSIFLS